MTDAQAIKKIGFWCNRANDAYAMGEADWVKDAKCKCDVPSYAAATAYLRYGDWSRAASVVEILCQKGGIDPKRHRWRQAR